jgi:hypothetical protein
LALARSFHFGSAKLITCTNCLAHVDDLHDLMKGVRHLLADDGAFVVEFPYLPDMLERNEWDTIYHEHLSYFSLGAITTLARLNGFAIRAAVRVPVHGGSLRVTLAKGDAFGPVMSSEPRALPAFEAFAHRSKMNMRSLVMELKHLRRRGKRIAAYGASAKGNVLFNACDIGTELVEYVADSIPFKQGKLTPGMHIPVLPESYIAEDRPDVILLTAWNFKDEIMAKLAAIPGYKPLIVTAVPNVEVLAA